MPLNDQLTCDKPWAVLDWTQKYWKKFKIWKKTDVSEDKRPQLVLSHDHETMQNLKEHAQADGLLESVFGSVE